LWVPIICQISQASEKCRNRAKRGDHISCSQVRMALSFQYSVVDEKQQTKNVSALWVEPNDSRRGKRLNEGVSIGHLNPSRH
jgi:hypothetical protein